jgi:hypothetical protein
MPQGTIDIIPEKGSLRIYILFASSSAKDSYILCLKQNSKSSGESELSETTAFGSVSV